ncbi:MAG: TraB/GumN family protein [Raineya sp.]
MKKYLIVFSIFFLGSEFVFAQKKPSKNHKEPKETPVSLELENSVFWEISGNGLKSPSYLFGTHHLYPASNIKKSDLIKEKINACQVVMGEIAMESMLAMSMATMKAMMMKDTTLKDLLGEKDYEKVDNYMKKNMGMGIAFFNNMRPMVLIQMITMSKASKDLGIENKQSQAVGELGDFSNTLDLYFQEYGKSQKKEIVGLETVEQQANILFNGYPLKRQAEMLLEAIEDEKGSSSMDNVKKLNELYKQQNLNELAKLSLDEQMMKKEEYNTLLKNRNNAWMPKIYELIHQKTAFIAIGALHLVGTDGVIYQLRKKGYQVKPIKVDL